MPTMVCFSGVGGDGITVEESPEQILDVLSHRNGRALFLTRNGRHDGVYINPQRVACWYASPGDDEPPVVRPFSGSI